MSTNIASSKGTAFITGSAQGIGRAIAIRLADDGFDVALNDLESNQVLLQELAAEISAKGRRNMITTGDVSIEASVEKMISEVVGQLGGIDVMVANAGIAFLGPLIETSVENWDRLFSINVRGVFLCYKHAGKQMIAQKRGGRIIGACSIAGKRGTALSACYSSSKFAVRGLTQCAAQEYGPYGITVNAYAPGVIATDMIGVFDKHFRDTQNLEEGEWTESRKSFTALGMNGSPTDVANLVSFLASKDSHFITGQSMIVDGGRIFD